MLSEIMEINLRSDLDGLSRHLRHNTPKVIERAAQSSINRTAATLRTKARREIAEEVEPRRGGQSTIGKLIRVRKATGRGLGSQSAYIDFDEMGIPVEATRKASIRKIRGKTGRYRVQVRGQSMVKAFKLGDSSKPLFTRSQAGIKRLYSYTVIQQATKAEVWDKLQEEAPSIFLPQFLRLVDIFDGYDKKTAASGRRR